MIPAIPILTQWPDLAMITYTRTLEKHLRGCENILDVGCADHSPLRFIDAKHKIGVDADARLLAKMKEAPLHDEYHEMYVKDLTKKFKKKSMDACIALDLIEHLDRNEGYRLMKDMESLAQKVVIIATPNGAMPIDHENPLHAHHSEWTAKDFQDAGYTVYGMFGFKFFRGYGYQQKYKPREFWAVLSALSEYTWAYDHPETAAALFAVKYV